MVLSGIIIDELPHYEITKKGDVYSHKSNKFLKPSFKKGGYLRVMLIDKNKKKRHFSLHRLVAITYISNPNNLNQVNHIDGNKQNNNVENLEWCTQSQNQKHAFKLGLQKPKYGEDNPASKLKKEDVLIIKRMLYLIDNNEINLSQNGVAKIFGISPSVITDIKSNNLWKNN